MNDTNCVFILPFINQGTQAQYPMAYSNPNFQPPSFSHNIDSPYSTVALIGTNQTRGGFSGFPNPTNP